MITAQVRTEIPRFARDLARFRNKTSARERRCLHRAMADRGRKAAISIAKRLTRNVSTPELERIIVAEVSPIGQFRDRRGRFTTAAARVSIRLIKGNRTSQVLRLMVLGGRVRIGSNEMEGMTIINGFDVRTARRIIRQTMRNGRLVKSPDVDVKTWYGRKQGNQNYSVVSNRHGLTLFRRVGKYYTATRRTGTRGGDRPSQFIAFIPKRATYRRNQFPFSSPIIRAMREGFLADQERCFNSNTRIGFGKRNGIRGVF